MLLKTTKPHPVYVIDNDSSDDSVAYVEKHFPEVQIIQTGDNLGYAGGYNEGLKPLKEKYAVLLNSDVRTTPGWLEPIMGHFEKYPNCGAVQPKIRWDREPEKFEYAGASGGFIDALGYPFCRGRVLHELEVDGGQYNDARPVFWATGACLAVNMDAFERAGKLDPCCSRTWRRLISAGACNASVMPFGWSLNRSISPWWSNFECRFSTKNLFELLQQLIILVKNLRSCALWVVFARLILDGIAGVKFVLEGKPKHTLAILQAHFAFYGRFTKIQRTRMSYNGLPLLFEEVKGPMRAAWYGNLRAWSQTLFCVFQVI